MLGFFKVLIKIYYIIAPDPICKYGLQSYGRGQDFIDKLGRKCTCSYDYKVVCDTKDCKYCNSITTQSILMETFLYSFSVFFFASACR